VSTRVRDPEGNGIEIYWEPDGPLSARGAGIG